MKSHFTKSFLIVIILFFSFTFSACEDRTTADAQLEDSWPTSSPEAQGMDSQALLQMIERISETNMDIHSLLVIRNGHLVLESNIYPYQSDAPHMIHSITKNVVSTLVGLAIEDGYIDSVDQKMMELLPEVDTDRMDERIQEITIEDLLTMQVGFHWDSDASRSMYESDNQLLYALQSEMANEPGEAFEYNSGATHILSVIIEETTGQSTLEYAEERIFNPLNITDVQWPVDKQGYNVGGDKMFMKPVDMAKFGCLYLQQGSWEGEQIIPESWVDAATQIHVEGNDYGYSWWITDFDGYVGSGAGGQYLAVLPEENMIVVVTSGIGNRHFGMLNSLTKNQILTAVVDDEGIDENPEALTELQNTIEEMGSPQETAGEILIPDTAAGISGNTYQMDNEESFTFEFSSENEAQIIWHRQGLGESLLTIGLDHIYRSNQIDDFLYDKQVDSQAMLRGYWEDDHTFIVDFKCLENPMAYFYEFEFDGETLHHTRSERINNSVFLQTTGIVEK